MNTLVHQEDDNKENDNWDSDFLEDIPSTKKVHTGHQHQKPLEQQVDIVADNTDTIKPGSISPMAATKPAARALSPLVEDWSDLVPEEEAKPFMGRLSNMKVCICSIAHLLIRLTSARSRDRPMQRSGSYIHETYLQEHRKLSEHLHHLQLYVRQHQTAIRQSRLQYK
jgi:hypothetical protein